MGLNTSNNPTLIRDQRYSAEIKEVLDVALQMDSHVRWVTDADFGDGNTLNIPTVGQLTTRDYSEGAQITLEDPATGSFTLTISKYKQAGISIPDKFKDDSWWVNQATTIYKDEIMRALMRQKESDIATLQGDQTASNPNTINTVDHRFVSLGTSNVGSLKDFRKSRLAFNKANVPGGGRVAFLDPNFTYELSETANIIGQDVYGPNNIIKDGMEGSTAAEVVADSRIFFTRMMGFDAFESNVLDSAIAETIVATGKESGSKTSTSANANLFLGKDALIGAMRTEPDMIEYYDGATRSTVIHATFRYGLKLYRPESMVVVLTDE